MNDIVERLRERLWGPDADYILDEAADEIERLRAALRRIGMPGEDVDCTKEGHMMAVLIARDALKEDKT